MIRELFHLGPISISPFGVALVGAFLVAYFQLRKGMRQLAIGGEEDASAVLFSAGLGGIVGGKVYYALLHQDWKLLFDRSGLVWYGGFLLASLLVMLTFRSRKLPFWPMMDAATVALAVGYAVGRIGCFLVGDDYGMPTDLPWGVAFPVGLPATTAGELRAFGAQVPADLPADTLLKVHPTQLYETGLALLIFWRGRQLLTRGLAAGSTAFAVLALLALERFCIEFLRAKDDRFFGPLTLAQLISLGILATVTLLWLKRRNAVG